MCAVGAGRGSSGRRQRRRRRGVVSLAGLSARQERGRFMDGEAYQLTCDHHSPRCCRATTHQLSAAGHLPYPTERRKLNLLFFLGFLIICHRYGDCLSDCQLYRAKYKFVPKNSNSAIILLLLLRRHAIFFDYYVKQTN